MWHASPPKAAPVTITVTLRSDRPSPVNCDALSEIVSVRGRIGLFEARQGMATSPEPAR